MAITASFVASPKTPVLAFANSDGTTFKGLITGGTLGTRVDSIGASTGDPTNGSILQLSVQVSGVDYVIGECTVPAGSGTNGALKSVAVLNPTDFPMLAFTESGSLWLAPGATLRARVKTAVAASYLLHLFGIAGDY